jgi:hypothetical protein
VSPANLNACLIGGLSDLDAEETCCLMEDAFTAGVVDETVAGDWEDIQVELGRLPPLPEDAAFEKVCRRLKTDEALQRLVQNLEKTYPPRRPPRNLALKASSKDPEVEALVDEPPVPEPCVRMTMPAEIYTVEERRRIAKQRNRQRKAVVRGKERAARHKNRP